MITPPTDPPPPPRAADPPSRNPPSKQPHPRAPNRQSRTPPSHAPRAESPGSAPPRTPLVHSPATPIDAPIPHAPSWRACPTAAPAFFTGASGFRRRAPPSVERSESRKGREMHGGRPLIGFSTLIYGVVGLAVVASGAVTRFRRHK